VRGDRPLCTVATASGVEMYSWRLLLNFCNEHPELRGVETALAKSRKLFQEDEQPSSSADESTLRAALRDLRMAADRSADAVLRSAQLAEATASAHAEIIAALRDTIRAYDSAMTSITAPEGLPGGFGSATG
jgi:hypothetical protein